MARKKGGSNGWKGKKGNNEVLPQHTAGLSGADSARISKLLEDFVNDPDQKAYTFKTVMKNVERARVHLLCRKMNMRSKSSGKGKNRYVTVYKTDKTYGGQSSVKSVKSEISDEATHRSSFAFSEESKRVLMDLFMRHPPGEEKIGEQKLTDQTRNTGESRGRIDDAFLRPRMSMSEIARKAESLFHNVKRVPQLAEIFRKRSKLPIASFRGAITSTIANHQVVLIVGETGCGKTTQVPQYLLDDMWAKGKACKIICTQPRRISAISVSERIAQERGETIGDSVGYKIRLEARGGRQSSILFCTGGVLLRVLVSSRESESGESRVKAENYISELTHIVVDEIHERDRYSDFMLTILRDLLPAHPHLRLVLMSATIDAERFSEYFGGCPVVRVPGFTHPVKTYYLEEVLSMLKTPQSNHLNATPTLLTSSSNEPKMGKEYQGALDEAVELLLSNEGFDSLLEIISSHGKLAVLNHKHSSTGVTPLMIFAGKGRVSDVCTLLSLGADCHVQAHDGTTALDWARRGDQAEVVEIITKHMDTPSSGLMEEQQLLQQYMKRANTDVIDYVLVEKLLNKVCTESKEGAILVFLPGWEDISRTQKTLLSISFFNDPSKFLVLPLHSMVPSAEQKKVFQPPPRGCRKIILSTNIAETSVTIDDVVYVINSGRLKEQSYDPLNNVSTLQSSWISKASAKQREGRAGRCQPGVCFHLYSKLKAVSLADFQVPEIKRMPIEELCLQVKMLNPNCKVVDFLNRTLDPPVLEAINNAIAVLQDIGALSLDEQLTDLGKKLGSLPVHPVASKMLFAGILLNCLGPALTLACAADYRDPFTLPMLPSDKHKADVAKAKLASLYGGKSDQLATVAAFDCWESAKKRGKESWFCSEYYVSRNIMYMLSGMRKQLLNELQRCGFVPSDASTCSLNSRDPGILRAVLVAGLYPRIGKLGSHRKFARFVETSSGMRARLLSRSILTKFSPDELYDKHGQGPLLLYDAVTRGDMGLQVRSCTVISPLPLLLLAKEIAVVPGDEMRNDPAKEDEVGKSDSLVDDGDKKVSLKDGKSDSLVDDGDKKLSLEDGKSDSLVDDGDKKVSLEDGKSGSPVDDSDKNDSDIGRTGSLEDGKSDSLVDDGDKKVSLEDGKSGSPVDDSDKNDSDIGRTGSLEDGKSDGPVNGDTRSLEDTSKEGIMTSPDSSVIVVVDGWVSFKMTALEVAQIYCLRERLSDALLFKISNPKEDLPPALVASTYAVICLMSYDGATGISLPMALGADVDILTSLVNAPGVINKTKDHLQQATSDDSRKLIATSGSSSISPLNDPTMTSPAPLPPTMISPAPPPPTMTSPAPPQPTTTTTTAPPRPTLHKSKGKNKPKKASPAPPQSTTIVSPAPPQPTTTASPAPPQPTITTTAAPPQPTIRTSPAPPQPTTLASPAPPQPTTTATTTAPPRPTLHKSKGKNTPKKVGERAGESPHFPLVVQPCVQASGTALKKRKREEKLKKADGGVEESTRIPMVEQEPNACTVKVEPCVQASATTPKKAGEAAGESPQIPMVVKPCVQTSGTALKKRKRKRGRKPKKADGGAEENPQIPMVEQQPNAGTIKVEPTMTSPAPPQPTTIASPAPPQPTTASPAPPQPTTTATAPPRPTLYKSKGKNKPKKAGERAGESPQIPLVVQPCVQASGTALKKRKKEGKPKKADGGAEESPQIPMVEQQPNAGTVKVEPCVQASATTPKKAGGAAGESPKIPMVVQQPNGDTVKMERCVQAKSNRI